MWKLKWTKCWIEKIFSEKDEFGHCKRIHRINHEKDVIGDVVFKDYDRAMYLAESMSELTQIRHVVIPAQTLMRILQCSAHFNGRKTDWSATSEHKE